jgi:hypothetical protein
MDPAGKHGLQNTELQSVNIAQASCSMLIERLNQSPHHALMPFITTMLLHMTSLMYLCFTE